MATTQTLGKPLSEIIAFEMPDHVYTRDDATTAAAVVMGEVIVVTAAVAAVDAVEASDGVEAVAAQPAQPAIYGIAVRKAASGEKVPCVVRGAVAVKSNLTGLSITAANALRAQGVKLI